MTALGLSSAPTQAATARTPVGLQPDRGILVLLRLHGAHPNVVMGQYALDLNGGPDLSAPVWEALAACPDTVPGNTCEDDIPTIGTADPIHFHFGFVGDPWRYPVRVSGYFGCDAQQSVLHAVVQADVAAASLDCDISVPAGEDTVVIEAWWRSGGPAYCYHGPGAAPPPSESNTWVYAVADYPDIPPAVPVEAITQAADCSHMPPMDPKATQVG
ncbi:MAG: hypothetical protein JO020_16650 [Chloroflexi bacterium]|nr:hypothetical protein [Chloroflexota bacterium]